MSRFVKVGQAARILGVSVQTLRRWEERGQLLPERRSDGGTRYYDLEKLLNLKDVETDLTIAYARSSAPEDSDAFKQQVQQLEAYCTQKGWHYEIIRDKGSGVDHNKSGLRKLLNLIIDKKIKRLVITNKDRLLRIGAELVFALCAARKIEVVILNNHEQPDLCEEELLEDVLELITTFHARLYQTSSETHQKLMEMVRAFSNSSS
ncbi:MAG: IS607 family transposase [Gammaproteobacteria bacterium]|jgi:predicted site-specific integrase-resolvase